MRKHILIAGFALLALVAGFGQGYTAHGISPSVTSVTSSNSHPGIAPSVTSVTPPPNWQNQSNWWTGAVPQSSGRHHHHHNNGNSLGYYYYPYYPYYPSYYDESADSAYSQQQPAQQVVEEPPTPAPTIFENRPGYKPPPLSEVAPETPAPAATDSAATSETSSEPEPATVLVFRDGHQLEIGNYVIVGNTLYNMSGKYRQYKIALADLDLDATIKANEDRGVEFKVPTGKKPA